MFLCYTKCVTHHMSFNQINTPNLKTNPNEVFNKIFKGGLTIALSIAASISIPNLVNAENVGNQIQPTQNTIQDINPTPARFHTEKPKNPAEISNLFASGVVFNVNVAGVNEHLILCTEPEVPETSYLSLKINDQFQQREYTKKLCLKKGGDTDLAFVYTNEKALETFLEKQSSIAKSEQDYIDLVNNGGSKQAVLTYRKKHVEEFSQKIGSISDLKPVNSLKFSNELRKVVVYTVPT